MNNLSYPLVLCLAGHLFVFLSAISSAQVVINEIMYDPDSPEPEWIELRNAGEDSVELEGWTMQDRTSARPVFPSISISGKSFLVLSRDTAALLSARAVTSGLVQISLPTLNNGGDDAVLRDADGKTVDSVSWSSGWGGRDGRSLERKSGMAQSNDPESWASSPDSSGATPGQRNGLAPLEYDLAIRSVTFISDTRTVRAVIENNGTEIAAYALVLLAYDENGDGEIQIGETQATEEIRNVNAGDSIVVLLPWRRSQTVGGEPALLEIDFSIDERTGNNLRAFPVRTKFADTGVLINEFVYDPASPQPEWVELYNAGELPVDLAGWVLHDAGASRPTIDSGLILPGEFAVLTADTGALRVLWTISSALIPVVLPTLNNGGDEIVLRNPEGEVSDSLRYSRDWGGENGASVERGRSGSDSVFWGTCQDPSGGTPGKRNSLLPPRYNLALVFAGFDADSSVVWTTVVNTGTRGVSQGSVVLYADENEDAVPDQSELLEEVALPEIAPGDSLVVRFAWERQLFPEGDAVIFVVRLPGDERVFDDTLRYFIRRPVADTGIVINEVMYDPDDPEPEWIEVYNRGENPVDLIDWNVEDATGKSPKLPARIVWPGEYLVLTSDSIELRGARSVSGGIVQIGLPSLNNGGDRVLLRNAAGVVVDSFRYTAAWGGRDGVSLERKTPRSPSADSSSWLNSLSEKGATPGAENSWEPILHDLALDSVRFDAELQVVNAVVANHGEEASDSSFLILYYDANDDGLGQSQELLTRQVLPPIPAKELMPVAVLWERPLLYDGESGILAIEYPADQRPDDNLATVRVAAPLADTGVIVNEFMYAPSASEPEWLELYNRGDSPVNIGGWTIRDNSTSSALFPDYLLAPGQYVVVTSDSAELYGARTVWSDVLSVLLPGLNNAGDQILLVNSSGSTLDSIPYRSTWGGNDGASLERKSPLLPGEDPENWVSSRDSSGGTPGRENSALRPRGNILVRDVHFDAQNSKVQAVIENDGETSPDTILIRLYHDADGNGTPSDDEELYREERTSPEPADSLLVNLVWPRELSLPGENGLVVVVSSDDENPDDNLGAFIAQPPLGDSGIIVNEVMFAPQSPEPEWVELYNAGELPVDLARWSLGDSGDDVVLPQIFLFPGDFVVLTADSASLAAIRDVDAVIVPVRLPALNNGEDQVRVHNASGVPVDSMAYVGNRVNGPGFSLERRWHADPGGDSASWGICQDSSGATPGRANSILPPAHNAAVDSAAFNSRTSTLTAWVRNTGIQGIEGAGLVLYRDSKSGMVPDEEYDRQVLPLLERRADIMIEMPWGLPLTDSGERVYVVVEYAPDEIESDNSIELLVRAAPPVEGLLITEIMYEPMLPGESSGAEYVELYNLLSRPVPLDGWYLADDKENAIRIPGNGMVIPPGSFGVVASDSSVYAQFPMLRGSGRSLVLNAGLGFGNGGDVIVLRNPLGETIDSVSYLPDWHWKGIEDTRGVALERLALNGPANEATNWSSSVARSGGTPGEQNSRRVSEVEGDAALQIDPETLSPDGDGFQDFARISWNFPDAAARIVIDVYDRWGRRVARPANNLPVAARGDVIWDGYGDNGRALSTGIYIVLLRAFDEDGRVIAEARRAMTLARRL